MFGFNSASAPTSTDLSQTEYDFDFIESVLHESGASLTNNYYFNLNGKHDGTLVTIANDDFVAKTNSDIVTGSPVFGFGV